MRKIILLLIYVLAATYAVARPIKIEVKRPEWNSPAVYTFDDVRDYRWITDHTVLRVWFYSGYILDLSVGNYEVKIVK